jgi:hypothetical protein
MRKYKFILLICLKSIIIKATFFYVQTIFIINGASILLGSLIIVFMLFIILLISNIILQRLLFFVRTLGAFILLSIIVLVAPYFYSSTPFWHLETVLTAMKSIVLSADSQIINDLGQQPFAYVKGYQILLFTMYILSPICTLWISLSFFEKRFELFIFIIYSKFKHVHIFNIINERTLALAKNIQAQHKRDLIVFHYKFDDPTFLSKYSETIKKIRPLIITRSIALLKHWGKKKNKAYYFLSFDDAYNAYLCHKILKSDHIVKLHFVSLYILDTPEESTHYVLKSLKSSVNTHVKLHFINEEEKIVESLLNKYPLIDQLEAYYKANKPFNLFIFGMGKAGKQFLKTLTPLCAYGIPNIKYNIHAFDLNANKIKREINLESPEFLSNEPITFHEVNIYNDSFYNTLTSIRDVPSFVIVALGNDQINIQTAIYIRKHYAEAVLERKQSNIPIRVLVDDENAKSLIKDTQFDQSMYDETKKQMEKKFESLDLYSFGLYSEIYDIQQLFNSDVDHLAHLTHFYRQHEHVEMKEIKACLKKLLNANNERITHLIGHFFKKGSRQKYSDLETKILQVIKDHSASSHHIFSKNRHQNINLLALAVIKSINEHTIKLQDERACALHFKMKLSYLKSKNITTASALYDDANHSVIRSLHQLENRRWVSYMRSIGYRQMPKSAIKPKYFKDSFIKLHARLLDEPLQELVVLTDKKDFYTHDVRILKNLLYVHETWMEVIKSYETK